MVKVKNTWILTLTGNHFMCMYVHVYMYKYVYNNINIIIITCRNIQIHDFILKLMDNGVYAYFKTKEEERCNLPLIFIIK